MRRRLSIGLVVLVAVVTSATALAQTSVGPVQSIGIATKAVKPAGRVFDLDLDRERGRLVWEADVASAGREFEVRIHARSGKVLRVRRDRTPDPEMALLRSAKVTAVRAVRISKRAARGAALEDLGLERQRGNVVWSADLGTGAGVEYDVVVDAVSGKVLRKVRDD